MKPIRIRPTDGTSSQGKEERIWLKKQLQNMNLWVCDSQANYLFFEGPEDLSEKCREAGILIRDCSNYPGLKAGFYRIAVRTHEENEQLIRGLKSALEEMAENHARELQEQL